MRRKNKRQILFATTIIALLIILVITITTQVTGFAIKQIKITKEEVPREQQEIQESEKWILEHPKIEINKDNQKQEEY